MLGGNRDMLSKSDKTANVIPGYETRVETHQISGVFFFILELKIKDISLFNFHIHIYYNNSFEWKQLTVHPRQRCTVY